jgi:alpha(1,3/1,4) fucosyltransferase
MEKIKVWFTDFWPEWNDEDFITPILNKHFEVVLDKNNPDVLFHSIFNRMQDTSNYKCKKILFLGENWRPGQFKSDYSISFDPHSETNYRLPLWQVYLILYPELKDILFGARVNHESFDQLCSFTVSNPSNFLRNSFYNQMQNNFLGKVKSYGRYMTNDMSLIQASSGRYWRDAKYEFFMKNKHKYSIVFENNSYPGYTTEKLMDAFLVGSMPIYWGDMKVEEDWNKEAFINLMSIGAEGAINKIKDLERNEHLFKEMYEKPVFTDEQKKKHKDNLTNFEKWIIEKIKK